MGNKHIYKKALMLLVLVGAACLKGHAAEASDTLEVHYRVGISSLDPNFADNKRQIDQFVDYVNATYANVPAQYLKLDVYSGASPEGPIELNRRLGEERGLALKEALLEKLGWLKGRISVYNQGARWGGLYKAIEDSNEPWKYDVLKIIQEGPSEDTWSRDDREAKLRKLDRGRVWSVLNSKYLPALRTSGSAVIARIENPTSKDTIVIRDTVYYVPEPCQPYIAPVFLNHVWALKTNLLMWGVIAPNIQAEFSLGKTNRWSIEGEFFAPWWIWSHNAHAEQFLNLGVELRYWLGNRQRHHRLDGWHIGPALAIGYYDFEWKRSEGYQGEYLNLYCNIGYQHRWGRRKQWAVDGGIGFGYIPTQYRHYLGSSKFPVGHEEKRDYHLMWQNTQWKHLIGATHANVTLAYMFNASKQDPLEGVVLPDPEPIMVPAEYEMPKLNYGNNNNMDKEAAKAAKEADKAAAKAAKEAEKANKEAAKNAAKAQAEADKAAAKAAKNAEKLAEAEAKTRAAADKEAAKAAKNAEKADKEAAKAAKNAEKADKEAAKLAEAEAKAKAKAEAEAAKAAEKANKEAAKAAKNAEKANKEAAKVTKNAEKADKEAAKIAEAEAKAKAKAEAEAAKAAEKANKEAAKIAEAEAKAKAKAEAEADKAKAAADKEAAKAKAAADKEAAKAKAAADKEAAKAAEAASKAKAKADAEAAKAAEKANKEAAKIAEAEAKAKEKAEAEAAKVKAAADKEAAKAAEAEAKAKAKAEAEAEKAKEKAAKEAAKAAAKAAKSNK